ncbi:MAG TPA: hypothetical protein VK304_07230 [Thermoleophilaceae bacterium]|nr:hypothetical protein [Thermoleophilaceae bacterium]
MRERYGAPLGLVLALLADDDFRDTVEEWQTLDQARRMEAVRGYARNSTPAQDLFLLLFSQASEEPNHEAARRRLFHRVTTVSAVEGEQVRDDDPKKAISSSAVRRDRLAIEKIVRRGAGRCGGCGMRLAHTRACSAEGQSVRRDYCDPCERNLDDYQRDLIRKAVGDVLDATVQVWGTGEPRVRKRRLRRAAKVSSTAAS